jgi:hypothetical protein
MLAIIRRPRSTFSSRESNSVIIALNSSSDISGCPSDQMLETWLGVKSQIAAAIFTYGKGTPKRSNPTAEFVADR